MTTKQWTVEVTITEQDRLTHAAATLVTPAARRLTGRGTARLNPADRRIPMIGDELAVARALSELSHHLLDATAEDIESVTHEDAHLVG